MTTEHELHVIFGTGALGLAVMRELIAQGKSIRMVNRRGSASVPDGVEVVRGDATDAASTRAVCKGAAVVYSCINAPYTDWPALFPPLQAGIIEGAASAGAKLVVAENLYMYGPVSGPIREDLPYAANTRKGRVRAQMATDLMKAHQQGIVRATAGRASDFYGPFAGEQGIFGDRIIPPLLAGKKVSILGSLDTPHTYTYINDFGKGLVTLGMHDEALGQAWHIPNAPTLTTREMLTLFFEEAKLPPKVGSVPNAIVRLMGLFIPIMREIEEMLYEFTEPFIVDSSKFVNAFGDIATPHREAVRQTLDWFRSHAATDTAKKNVQVSGKAR